MHRVLKEAKDAKFATLLEEVTSNSSNTNRDASLGKRTVVTIPEDLPLNSAEFSVLSKGLTFVPTGNKTDEYQVKADCEKFFRRLRLKAHFHDREDDHHEQDNHTDPFTKFDKKTSTWTPPDGKFSAMDHYIDRCRRSIASRNYTRRPTFSNLTQEEKSALQDLRRRTLNQRTKVVQWLYGNVTSTFRKQTANCRTTVFTNVLTPTPFSKTRKSLRTPLRPWSLQASSHQRPSILWSPHRALRVSICCLRFINQTTLGVPLSLRAAAQLRTSQRTLMKWWPHSLNNFQLTSKIQTML